ncbi:hypothetical protein NMY22_g1022 [Coprinellus aureogranulatus]|nr:hypothetical protein NMY22_g1022 [Coprinellus aureogranulatus]
MSSNSKGHSHTRRWGQFLGLFKGRRSQSNRNIVQSEVVPLDPRPSQVDRGVDLEDRGSSDVSLSQSRRSGSGFVGSANANANASLETRFTSTEGVQTPVVLEGSGSIHHHGQIFQTTNTGNGPVNNVGHIENASFHLSDGGPGALLWASLPKQRDTSSQHSEYLKGSREGDVQAVLGWIDQAPPGELVLWVYGPAGIGKSTLAHHLTHLLRADDRLAASVFLTGLPNDARSAESVVKIMAREMGTTHAPLIPLILSAISSCNGAPLPVHIEKYLRDPYLEATLVLREPLPVDAFSSLARLPAHLVESVKSELAALQTRHPLGSTQLIHPAGTVFHLSFIEYLQSSLTPPDIAFHISAFKSHSLLAESCLLELRDFLPIAEHVSPSNLAALQKYAVKHMPTHVHLGTPAVEPNSDADWKQTPHSSLLQDFALTPLFHWGRLLLALVQQGYSLETIEFPLGSPGGLVYAVATRLNGRDVAILPVRISCLEIAARLDTSFAECWLTLGWSYLFLARFTRSRDACDQAVRAHQHAVEVGGSCGEVNMGCLMFALGTSLNARHEYFEDDCDLSDAIVAHRSALTLYPPGHPERGASLNNLGCSLSRTGSVSDLRESIALGREFLALLPPGHLGRCFALNNLANGLTKTGSSSDLREGISMHREALKLCPPGHRAREDIPHNLALALSGTGSIAALHESISLHRERLELCPPDHPFRALFLSNKLTNVLRKTGPATGFQESVRLHCETLGFKPPGHPNWVTHVRGLAYALLFISITSTSEPVRVTAAQEVVYLRREVLELCPPGHPDRCGSLEDLANTLFLTDGDMQEVISLHRQALGLRPPGHPDRAISLNNLAMMLSNTQSVGNFQESILLSREALELCPPDHPEHWLYLINLARSLSTTGLIGDLEESVCLGREALDLCPPGLKYRGAVLSSLAESLSQMGSYEDLQEAICLHREVLGDSRNAQSLNNLALSLLLSFEVSGAMQFLDEAIPLARESLSLLPPGQEDRFHTLATLAAALRFHPQHHDEALQLGRESISLLPPSFPYRSEFLRILAAVLLSRYEHSRTIEELEEAILICEEALALCPPNNYHRPKLLALQSKLAKARSAIASVIFFVGGHIHSSLVRYLVIAFRTSYDWLCSAHTTTPTLNTPDLKDIAPAANILGPVPGIERPIQPFRINRDCNPLANFTLLPTSSPAEQLHTTTTTPSPHLASVSQTLLLTTHPPSQNINPSPASPGSYYPPHRASADNLERSRRGSFPEESLFLEDASHPYRRFIVSEPYPSLKRLAIAMGASAKSMPFRGFGGEEQVRFGSSTS